MTSCPLSLSTAVVYDRSEHYYAIGNTPPKQLIPANVSNPKVLCLAAGDLRSCFFSVSRADMKNHETVSFVVNDKNAAIIARNILLLILSIHPELRCTPSDLWAIWYSLYLNQSQWGFVSRVLHLLLDKKRNILQDLQISISPKTLHGCRQVWKMWLHADIPTIKVKMMKASYEKRYNKIDQREQMHIHFVRQGYLGGSFLNHSEAAATLPGLHAYEERLHNLCHESQFKDFMICSNLEGTPVVNKTFFMDTERYNLHYSSVFYEGFHLWDFRPKKDTLESYCRSQHAEWVLDLCAISRKIIFEFIQGDCNSVCLRNPRWYQRFDVIDTSNVCDYVGLVGLLLTCRPLISPDGIMFTTSMTAHTRSVSDMHYLNKELILGCEKWSGAYGWSCHGCDDSTDSLNIEWPLASNKAPFCFQWSPTTTRDISEEDVLTVTRKLLNPSYFFSLYSTAIVILFLMAQRNICPLDFLRKFKREFLFVNFVELELWLSQLACNKVESMWIDIDLTDNNLFFKQPNNQPWLRAKGLLQGKIQHFTILALETTSTGKTVSCRFLAPAELLLSSIEVYNYNTVVQKLSGIKATARKRELAVSEDFVPFSSWPWNKNNISCESAPPRKPSKLKGLQNWKDLSRRSSFDGKWADNILPVVSSQIMTKYELLASRSVVVGGVSNDDPMISTKELLLSLVADGKQKNVICVDDGAGAVNMVIVKEGIYQDESLGVPLLDLIIFIPDKPFSSESIPSELEQHHPDDPNLDRVVLPWKSRKYFIDLVKTLAGIFKQTRNAWGSAGEIQHLLFPIIFPTRWEKIEEMRNYVIVNAKLGTLRYRNDRVLDIMMALKEHGNSLIKEKKFDQAIFSYTLAALKLESIDIDDADPEIRELTAQCHSNIAFAKYCVATEDALVEAIRSCSFAIQLLPTWGKPYYRRGLCYEKQGLMKLAVKDLKVASRHHPKDEHIKRVINRVQKKGSKK